MLHGTTPTIQFDVIDKAGSQLRALKLSWCPTCLGITGSVQEQYNGTVTVLCFCILGQTSLGTPLMVATCRFRERQIGLYGWPNSDHRHADGTSWHTPHFAGPYPFRPRTEGERRFVKRQIASGRSEISGIIVPPSMPPSHAPRKRKEA